MANYTKGLGMKVNVKNGKQEKSGSTCNRLW